MAQIEQAALAAHATPASTAALPPDAQLSGLTIPDHPNTTTTSAALPAMTSPAPTTSLAARALTAHAPQEPSEAHRTDLLAEPEVITALPESPRPAPTAAPAAEHTAQSLITLPPPPLFTAQQLHLAASGLEYLALPLLNYLDPEARYCLIDSLQGSAKFQHLALQAVTLPAKRDYIALRSKQYAQQQAQQQAQPSARIPLRDNERKELARWARVPLPLNRPDTALAFSATPLEAQLDYSVLTPAWYNPPQSVPEQLALPQGQLEVQLGSERLRLDPDCNFLLDVLGLLLQQTGFCTIPIFRPGQTRSAKTAYQCLDAACRKPQSLYALFFLSEGGLSLEQSKSRLYAPLYSAALDTSASARLSQLQDHRRLSGHNAAPGHPHQDRAASGPAARGALCRGPYALLPARAWRPASPDCALRRLAPALSGAQCPAQRAELQSTSVPWYHRRALAAPRANGRVQPPRRRTPAQAGLAQ